MEIKEAVEIVRNTWGSKGLRPEEYNAHKVIMDALCDGYTLCKVDSAISGMNSLYAKAEEYAKADEVVGDCIDILKRACL